MIADGRNHVSLRSPSVWEAELKAAYAKLHTPGPLLRPEPPLSRVRILCAWSAA